MDIITFAEAYGHSLYPVQRVVLKLFYGLELDDQVEFPVPLPPGMGAPDDLPPTFTEAGYAGKLWKEGRLNCRPSDGPFTELLLSTGRRAGKDHMLILMLAYETFLKAEKGQGFEGLMDGSAITIGLVSFTVDQAQSVFRDAVGLALTSPPLAGRKANETQAQVNFQTDKDIEDYGSWEGSRRQAQSSVRFRVFPTRVAALRGFNHGFMGVSEAAWLPISGSMDIYQCVTGSLHVLKGRLAMLTSPGQPSNSFQELWKLGWSDTKVHPSRLCIEIPTWEMNLGCQVPEPRPDRCMTDYMREYGGQLMEELPLTIPLRLQHRLASVVGSDPGDQNDTIIQALGAWLDERGA